MRSENFVRLLYFALSVTAVLAATCAPLGLSPSSAEPFTASISVGLLLAALSLAGFAAWRDLHLFAKWLVVAGMIATLFTSLGFADPDTTLSNHSVFWCIAAVPVAGFVLLGRVRLTGRRDSHHLLSKHPGRVLELDAIQVFLEAQRGAPAGGVVQVEGALENCYDAVRTVTLGFAWRNGTSQVTQEISMAPNGLSPVRCSVAVPPHLRGLQHLWVTVDVKGARGRRTKRLRGRPVRNRVTRDEQLVGLAVGVITWGGGIHFPVVIEPSTGERRVA